MPEIVRAIAEPLSKVDKVTIVSTGAGNGNNGLGASRLTGDIVNMVAQVPALFELLSGTRIGDLMNRVPALAGQENEADGAKGASASANGAGTTVEAKPSDRNQ
jgi:flotillin